LGGNTGSLGVSSEDGEEVGEIDEGVVEAAAVVVLAFPINSTVVSNSEFLGGVEGEID
jgi:hypothetical protein